ncbi:MAG: aspartate aminotransferase family protein [Fimbriimonas sp.]|nr:aspartate aminotransferase family protein [Fimbriimonas sp.]
MNLDNRSIAVEGDVNLSDRRQRWQVEQLSESTLQMLADDADVFLRQSLSTPCLNAIRAAQGSWIEDVEGRRYLDFHGNSVHQVGYGHPRVVQAIRDQLDSLPFCPRRYTNAPSIALARKLGELAPGRLNKVLFATGGSSAIGIAMKLARVATGRFKTVSMWGSFHGASLDSISVGGEAQFRSHIGPLLPGTSHVPPPDPRRCPLNCGGVCSMACASYLSYVLEHEGDVGAVIAEPIRATTGVVPPEGYWREVRDACDRHGALLIFDEIPVGLGRTGCMFATEWTGVEPDILVLGKGLGGGIFPLAAVIAHEDLDVAGQVSLGHYTHEKSPVGAAAGLATLSIIEEENLLERSRTLGHELVCRLKGMMKRHSSMVEVRGVGLTVGVEMASRTVAEETMYRALDHGLNFKVSEGTVLTLTPPLTISNEELDLAVDALDAALGEAES